MEYGLINRKDKDIVVDNLEDYEFELINFILFLIKHVLNI